MKRDRHTLLLEAYGYRWYRVGGLDYLLKRSDIDTGMRRGRRVTRREPGSHHTSSLRKQGPITTGRYCKACRQPSGATVRPRRMGPCVRGDDGDMPGATKIYIPTITPSLPRRSSAPSMGSLCRVEKR